VFAQKQEMICTWLAVAQCHRYSTNPFYTGKCIPQKGAFCC